MLNQVLSMSRLGAAGAVAQLVADVPLSSVQVVELEEMLINTSFLKLFFLSYLLSYGFDEIKGEGNEGGANQQSWENWSNDDTEQEVAKLMEEDVGAAMQFLQSKALCIMPISLASAIFRARPPNASTLINTESNTPS
jgi:hypothetical protein